MGLTGCGFYCGFTVGFHSVTVGLKQGANGVKIDTPFLVGLTTCSQTSPKNNYVVLVFPNFSIAFPQRPLAGSQEPNELLFAFGSDCR